MPCATSLIDGFDPMLGPFRFEDALQAVLQGLRGQRWEVIQRDDLTTFEDRPGPQLFAGIHEQVFQRDFFAVALLVHRHEAAGPIASMLGILARESSNQRPKPLQSHAL
jgi:hypothetical protein